MNSNPYEVLGVEKNASDSDIKKAYRKKAAKCHPDAGGDGNEFCELAIAYEKIGDPESRRQFDSGETKYASNIVERNIADLLKSIYDSIESTDDLERVSNVLKMAIDRVDSRIEECRDELSDTDERIARVKQLLKNAEAWTLVDPDVDKGHTQEIAVTILKKRIEALEEHKATWAAREKVQRDTFAELRKFVDLSRQVPSGKSFAGANADRIVFSTGSSFSPRRSSVNRWG